MIHRLAGLLAECNWPQRRRWRDAGEWRRCPTRGPDPLAGLCGLDDKAAIRFTNGARRVLTAPVAGTRQLARSAGGRGGPVPGDDGSARPAMADGRRLRPN